MTVTLDFETINSSAEMYDIMTQKLNFPSYFGRNLDALSDVLTDIDEPTMIIIKNPGKCFSLLENGYIFRLIKLLGICEGRNENFSVEIE